MRWRKSEMSSSVEVEICVGTSTVRIVGLRMAVLTLSATFFYGFSVVGTLADVDLVFGFLAPAVYVVAVTLACVGPYVTGLGEGLG
jgi:hypothetical protein